MDLGVLLQVLRSLEALGAQVAVVRLQRHMYTQMGGDVISLDGDGAAVVPVAGQRQVVGGLAANVLVTQVVVQYFRSIEDEAASVPVAVEWSLHVGVPHLLVGFLWLRDIGLTRLLGVAVGQAKQGVVQAKRRGCTSWLHGESRVVERGRVVQELGWLGLVRMVLQVSAPLQRGVCRQLGREGGLGRAVAGLCRW